jgi:hypothetical protein
VGDSKGRLKVAKNNRMETFGYFKKNTEKWRQRELRRLERRRNKKRKKRSAITKIRLQAL